MQQAADCGVDMISVTVGWQEAPESSIGRDVAPGHWNYLAARAKRMFPDTLIAFGNRLPDPRMANECIGEGRVRLLGGLPADARRPGAGAQGGRGPARRSAALRRLAQLPVARVPRPALHLHHEPGARPRGRARVRGHAGRGEEEDHGHRRRSRRHGVRDHRAPRAVTRSPSIDRPIASAATCSAMRTHDLARPDDLLSRGAALRGDGGEARRRDEARYRGERQADARVLHQYDVVHRRRRRAHRPRRLRRHAGARAPGRRARGRRRARRDRQARGGDRRRQGRAGGRRVR